MACELLSKIQFLNSAYLSKISEFKRKMEQNSFLSLPLRFLSSDRSDGTTLSQLQRERGMPVLVVDLWHTKCSKCPAALEKLNASASSADSTSVLYISIALSQGDDNFDVALDVSDGYASSR